MKSWQYLIGIPAMLFLTSCVTSGPTADQSPRDYAVMTATPYQAEIDLAQHRLDKFLRHLDSNRRALLAQTQYVAVQAYELTAGEVPSLTSRLGRGSISSSAYSQDPRSRTDVPVKFVLLIDKNTRKILHDEGVLIMDVPPRYSLARFEDVQALYIGTE